MANFNTHLNVAISITGTAAATLLAADHIEFNVMLWLWFLGIIGGLLPDVDSDNSTSLDIIFNLFAFALIIIGMRYMMTNQFQQISFFQLLVLPLSTYAFMRYGIRIIFEKITVHRGSCHSLLFLTLCALLTTQLTWQLTSSYSSSFHSSNSEILAWLSGGFIFLGGLIHLLLDEIYSVDLVNVRIKRSFATALKIADFQNISLTLGMLIAVIALVFLSPTTDSTVKILSDWGAFRFY